MIFVWSFFFYGFGGYLLEKAFAGATHAPLQVRKGFLLLPLCPVYGLGMVAVLALTPPGADSWWEAVLWGMALCTLVEYAVHLFYDKALGVRFWDYRGDFANVGGRVCLTFSLAWGVLSALSLELLQPAVVWISAAVPDWCAWFLLAVLAGDGVLSWRVLQRRRDPEALGWGNLRRELLSELPARPAGRGLPEGK